jgi:hypothetical protein
MRMSDLQARIEASLREQPRTAYELVDLTGHGLYDVVYCLLMLQRAQSVVQSGERWVVK